MVFGGFNREGWMKGGGKTGGGGGGGGGKRRVKRGKEEINDRKKCEGIDVRLNNM